MDDQPDQAKEQSEINKIDLSALQGFSFGTQWTPAEKASPQRREGREREYQGSREGQGGARPPRDRRPMRRPASDQPRADRGSPVDRRGGQPPREQYQNFRERRDRGPAQPDNRPYISTVFDVVFYPEDEVFHKIVQRVRDSKHTFELFEIARAVLGKSERCVIVVRRKPEGAGEHAPVHVSAVDGLPFETEEAAVDYVVRTQMGHFFNIEEVEVEPPKGSFAVVSRCSITGELLGPPNYHRYQSILQQHHASRLPNMSFERFKDRLESVREPEVIAAWLEKMKKGVRYTWKTPAEGTEAPVFEALEDARNFLLATARDQVVRPLEHARFHGKLLEALPDGEIRRAIEGQLERQRRFPLDSANALRGRLRREGFTIFKKGSKGVSYVCAVKRRFRVPGQTFSESINSLIGFIEANPLISIRELPAKMLGVEPPQPPQPAESAQAAQPTEPAQPIQVAEPPQPAESSQPAEAAETARPDAPAPEGESAKPAADEKSSNLEEEALVRRVLIDLRWLVTEGYVTEYSDGRLFAPPPARQQHSKEEDEGDDQSSESESEESASDSGHAEPDAESTPETSDAETTESSPEVAAAAEAPPTVEEPAASEQAPVAAPEVVNEPVVASEPEPEVQSTPEETPPPAVAPKADPPKTEPDAGA